MDGTEVREWVRNQIIIYMENGLKVDKKGPWESRWDDYHSHPGASGLRYWPLMGKRCRDGFSDV